MEKNFSFFKKSSPFLLFVLALSGLLPSTAQATDEVVTNSVKRAFRIFCAITAIHAVRLEFKDTTPENLLTGDQFTQEMKDAWNKGEYQKVITTLVKGWDDFIVAGVFGQYFWPRMVKSILALELLNKFHTFFTKPECIAGDIFDPYNVVVAVAAINTSNMADAK